MILISSTLMGKHFILLSFPWKHNWMAEIIILKIE